MLVATEAPTWTSVAEGLESLAAAAALLVGGLFAYYRFAKGRVGRVRMSLGLSASLHRLEGQERLALLVTVTLRNDGGAVANLTGEGEPHLVAAEFLGSEDWAEAGEVGVDWEAERVRAELVVLFRRSSPDDPFPVEPGEVASETVVLALPSDVFACRVQAWVHAVSGFRARRRTWWAQTIVLREETGDGDDQGPGRARAVPEASP